MATTYEDSILRRDGERWLRAQDPPAWCQYRGEMKDTLEWFKEVQAGVHIKDGRLLGMFIGGYGGRLSYVDAEIIITSMNGDQNPDSSPSHARRERALEAIEKRYLTGFVIGKGATKSRATAGKKRKQDEDAKDIFFPCKNMPTGHEGWLADWFLPVMIWPQKVLDDQGQPRPGAVWMVKFQKWNLEQRSWWANPAHPAPPPLSGRDFTITAPNEQCLVCGVESKRIFREHFVCLQNSCSAHWQAGGAVITQDTPLTYSDLFLKERVDPRSVTVDVPSPYPLLCADFNTWWQEQYSNKMGMIHRELQSADLNDPQHIAKLKNDVEEVLSVFTSGFCCPACKMMNSRDDWSMWRCRNSKCSQNYTRPGHPPVLSVDHVALWPSPNVKDFRESRYYQSTTDAGLFTAHNFELMPGCSIILLKPKPGTNTIAGGSDYLFNRFQNFANAGSLNLRRQITNSPGGRMLTGHFSHNFGTPYKFGVPTPSTPFQDAVPEVRDAVTLANSWTNAIRGVTTCPNFNQLYLAGYIKGEGMKFHDDGEENLGNTVATWTLGGAGLFSIRIKPTLYYGRTTTNTGQTANAKWISEDPVPPECLKHDERRALRDQLDVGQISPQQWQQNFQNLMIDQKGSKCPPVLVVPVNHGDILVMRGENVQKIYDHSAVVETPVRFALTFRHITQDGSGDGKQKKSSTDLSFKRMYEPEDDDDIADPNGKGRLDSKDKPSSSKHSNALGDGSNEHGHSQLARESKFGYRDRPRLTAPSSSVGKRVPKDSRPSIRDLRLAKSCSGPLRRSERLIAIASRNVKARG